MVLVTLILSSQGSRNTSDTKDYFCQKGEYNDMATLFFTSQESAIRQLFHLDGKTFLISFLHQH